MKKYNVIFIAFLLAIVGSISVKRRKIELTVSPNPTSADGNIL